MNLKPPTIPFGIVACTFSDNLSRNSCMWFRRTLPLTIVLLWIQFLAELWRAKRAWGAPWVSKSTHPRKLAKQVTVHRPSSPTLLRFWFQTDLRRENSASYLKNTGGEDLFLPWSRVGRALRPIFLLWLVKIWQVSSCGKSMQHLETCLLWQLKLTEFCVNLWCF